MSGNGSNLQALLDSDDIRPHIHLVVSNRADAYGLQRAAQAGCPTKTHLRKDFENRAEFDRELAKCLEEQQIDLIVLAGWMHILGEEYLKNAPGRTINLHPALPGHYPGLNAIERAWNDKREITGCMVHDVVLEVDAGQVLGTSEVKISEYQNLASLTTAVHRAEHTLLPRVVREWLGLASVSKTEQGVPRSLSSEGA